MAKHVCPVWIGYLLASPIRKLLQNPSGILEPYVQADMVVLDVGSAMGFFSLPMAEMIKPNGRVICVDMQERMIKVLEKKVQKAGLSPLIETVICDENSLNIEAFTGKVDFALAFAVLHEVPDQSHFLFEIHQALKPGGRVLLSEPAGHVKAKDFDQSLSLAEINNFVIVDRPQIYRSLSVILEKAENNR